MTSDENNFKVHVFPSEVFDNASRIDINRISETIKARQKIKIIALWFAIKRWKIIFKLKEPDDSGNCQLCLLYNSQKIDCYNDALEDYCPIAESGHIKCKGTHWDDLNQYWGKKLFLERNPRFLGILHRLGYELKVDNLMRYKPVVDIQTYKSVRSLIKFLMKILDIELTKWIAISSWREVNSFMVVELDNFLIKKLEEDEKDERKIFKKTTKRT